MKTTIDARGLSCPQPVLMTMDEIKKNTANEILVLVDTEASRENVSRAAQSKGWQVASITEEDEVYHLALKKG